MILSSVQSLQTYLVMICQDNIIEANSLPVSEIHVLPLGAFKIQLHI